MTIQKITKIKAAEKQLETAIRLFFENIDHLSSYTLAAASREITDDLCEKLKDEIFRAELARLGDPQKVRLSFREELRIQIKDEYFKEALGLSRKAQNFLKHADNDPHAEREELSVDELAFVILFGIKNFILLEKRVTPAMSTFVCWFGAAKPHLVTSDANDHFTNLIVNMRKTFPDLYSRQAFYL
jgi:hypothetical protein